VGKGDGILPGLPREADAIVAETLRVIRHILATAPTTVGGFLP
jgi:hypothetical protein